MKQLHVLPLVLTASLCIAQTLSPKSLPQQSDDISITQAVGKVRAFSAAIGRPADSPNDHRVRIQELLFYGQKMRVWTVLEKRGATIDLDARTGRIYSFYEVWRSYERNKRIGRTNTVFFTSDEQARQRLRTLSTQIGIPTTWPMHGFVIKRDQSGKYANMGHVGAVYKDASGMVIATISIDSQDGALLSYTRSP